MHGLPKLQRYSTLVNTFPDPLHIGSQASLIATIFVEFFCSILLILGVAVRVVLIPLIFTMLVIIFMVHAGDSMSKVELPLLYLSIYCVLFLGGSGHFSLNLSSFLPNNKWINWLFDIS